MQSLLKLSVVFLPLMWLQFLKLKLTTMYGKTSCKNRSFILATSAIHLINVVPVCLLGFTQTKVMFDSPIHPSIHKYFSNIEGRIQSALKSYVCKLEQSAATQLEMGKSQRRAMLLACVVLLVSYGSILMGKQVLKGAVDVFCNRNTQ